MSKPLVSKAINQPWLIKNELCRILSFPLNFFFACLSGVIPKLNWQIYGLPIWQIDRRATIGIGQRLCLRSSKQSNPLSPNHPVVISCRGSAKLKIGDYFSITGGSVVASKQITIGDHVTVGANVIITDSDFHSIDPLKRREILDSGKAAPILIEDDVFIGANSIILKGVTIGKNSVIGAGSIVTSSFPENSIIAGNPAQLIRQI